MMEGRERVMLEKEMPTPRFLLTPDLIIIQSVSSIGLEALMARKQVLSYSFATPPEYQIYSRYTPHMVAFTREELEERLERILLRKQYVEEEVLEAIRTHHGFRFDGQVTERFRQMCRDLLKGVS